MLRSLSAAVLLIPVSASVQAEPVWFVVAELQPSRNESFLLPLSDPADIDAARRRIAEGEASGVGSIVSARIAAGGDGFNRDVNHGGKPWSWHVAGFNGFADATIELCDGWPGFIEQDVQAFIDNTGGVICFWGYTVVAELANAPAFAIDEGLDGAWYDPATPGQGLFVDVIADRELTAIGWYSYADGAPPAPGDGHRWYTGIGPHAGDSAQLQLLLSSGGRFADDAPVDTGQAGQAELRFADCDRATLQYDFGGGHSGSIDLRRVAARPGCVVR